MDISNRHLPFFTIYISYINQLNPHFIKDQPLQKLKQILNPNFELLSAVGNFLKQGIDLRG